MLSPRAEWARRAGRWLVPLALVALAPKCLVCLAAYAGIGAALGLSLAGPELCGAAPMGFPLGAMAWLAAVGFVSAMAGRRLRSHCPKPARAEAR